MHVTGPKDIFDVALSYASEDAAYVSEVASALKRVGLRVFFDRYEQVNMWGKDLYVHLDRVYREQARFCVMFISKHYASKVWTSHERRSAQARALEESREYVLPARLDGTDIPGMPPTIAWLDAKAIGPDDLAAAIVSKVKGVDESQRELGRLGDFSYLRTLAERTFDYRGYASVDLSATRSMEYDTLGIAPPGGGEVSFGVDYVYRGSRQEPLTAYDWHEFCSQVWDEYGEDNALLFTDRDIEVAALTGLDRITDHIWLRRDTRGRIAVLAVIDTPLDINRSGEVIQRCYAALLSIVGDRE